MISSPGQSLDASVRENHIAFNHGEYDPESAEGQHVLAHELAHVRQQAKGGIQRLTADSEVEIGNPESQYEHEATAVAKEIVDPTSERTTRLTPSPLAVLRTEEDTYFDHVIEAIKAESDLDEEDIARIKREAAEEVEGTDYEGARGHDELNIKILEKAEEKIREKREVIEEKSEVEAELDEAKVDAVTGAAAAEQGNEDVEVAEGVPAAEAADREQALTDRQEELLEEVEELEAELDSLLSEENLRLTDAQQQELQSVADRVASIIGGPAGDVVATFIASLTADQAVGMSLGSIVMTAIGVSQAPAAVVVTTVLLAITTGLSMLVGRLGEGNEERVVSPDKEEF